MKKRIAGSALIAASMVLAFHPVLLKTGDSQERIKFSKVRYVQIQSEQCQSRFAFVTVYKKRGESYEKK
jgi:hypothetical protein